MKNQLTAAVEQHYSAAQVGGLLGIDESTVWRLHKRYVESGGKEGLGPCHKLGHRVSRFPASGVNRYLASRRTVLAG